MDNWEPAFANSAFFKFLGSAVGFGFHGVLCNWIKVYLLAFFMIVSVVPYAWLEIKLENIRKIKNVGRLWPKCNAWWSNRGRRTYHADLAHYVTSFTSSPRFLVFSSCNFGIFGFGFVSDFTLSFSFGVSFCFRFIFTLQKIVSWFFRYVLCLFQCGVCFASQPRRCYSI